MLATIAVLAQAAAEGGVDGLDEAADAVIAPTFVTLIVTLLLPVAVAAVTKLSASSRLRAVLLLVFSAINTLITGAVLDTGYAIISKETFLTWLVQTAIAMASYLGFYQPVFNINARVAPNTGVTDAKNPPA